MKNKKAYFTLYLIALLAFCQGAFAQIGVSPKFGIKQIDPETSWYEVNDFVLNETLSGDINAMIGNDDTPREDILYTKFQSELVMWGKKIASESFTFGFSDKGKLFGGEGYTDIFFLCPINNDYARQFYLLTGWKYNLTKYVDIDIGGNITYSDDKIAGPGFVTNLGTHSQGDIFVGLIGNCLLSPFIYGIYNFEYDQTELRIGIRENYNLDKFLPIKGLWLNFFAYYGLINANRFNGQDANPITHTYWKNSYSYVQTELSLSWQIDDNWGVSLGLGVAYNTGSDTQAGFENIDNSPDSNVYTTCGVAYKF